MIDVLKRKELVRELVDKLLPAVSVNLRWDAEFTKPLKKWLSPQFQLLCSPQL